MALTASPGDTQFSALTTGSAPNTPLVRLDANGLEFNGGGILAPSGTGWTLTGTITTLAATTGNITTLNTTTGNITTVNATTVTGATIGTADTGALIGNSLTLTGTTPKIKVGLGLGSVTANAMQLGAADGNSITVASGEYGMTIYTRGAAASGQATGILHTAQIYGTSASNRAGLMGNNTALTIQTGGATNTVLQPTYARRSSLKLIQGLAAASVAMSPTSSSLENASIATITSIVGATGTASGTTVGTAHRLSAGDVVYISGNTEATFNGRQTLLTASTNVFTFATGTTATGTGGTIYSTPATTSVIATGTASGTVGSITTVAAHGLGPNGFVTISGCSVGGWNGTWKVLSTGSATTCTVQLATTPSGASDGNISSTTLVTGEYSCMEMSTSLLHNLTCETWSGTASQRKAAYIRVKNASDTGAFGLPYLLYLEDPHPVTMFTQASTSQTNARMLGIMTKFRAGAAWVASTAYLVGERVTNGGSSYVCLYPHTSHSSTFSTDLAAGYWRIEVSTATAYNIPLLPSEAYLNGTVGMVTATATITAAATPTWTWGTDDHVKEVTVGVGASAPYAYVVTLSPTGVPEGAVFHIRAKITYTAGANVGTLTLVDGGSGTPTLFTRAAAAADETYGITAVFDGTNWKLYNSALIVTA